MVDKFKINPLSAITLNSLAMKLFQINYYNSNIIIPIGRRYYNNDIKQTYYGGHVDVYKPFTLMV